MKRPLMLIFAIFISLLLACSVQAAETLKIDPQHSYVLWHIKHFNFSTQSGKWYAEGTLVIDEDKLQNSKVNVSIPVANMITGIAELDKHLKGKLFFDVKQFPIATFISDKVVITGKKTAKVYGILTVHGVSKPIILEVKLNLVGVSPITEKKTVGFTANTKLKRSDFGINALLPGVGDEVKIDIEVEAYKDSGNKDAN